MQLVDPAHQREISVRSWARQVIDAAPADPERPGLAADAQFTRAVDHRFALGNRPALPSDTAKKIILQRQLAYLCVQRLHVPGPDRVVRYDSAEYTGGAFQDLRAPLRDLIRVNGELLGQRRQCLLASDGCRGHFGFERQAVNPARSSGHGLSSLSAIMPMPQSSAWSRIDHQRRASSPKASATGPACRCGRG